MSRHASVPHHSPAHCPCLLVFGDPAVCRVCPRSAQAQPALKQHTDSSRGVQTVDVPVIGGHAGITILPLFSQATGFDSARLSDEDIKALTVRTQDGGTEVVLAKAGKGSATLSMAYAAAIFGDACMRGMSGDAPIECTYVETDIVPGLSYFSTPCELSKGGVGKVLGNGKLSASEEEALVMLKVELKSSIDKGLEFVQQHPI
jgi:malate dehydrogenase